MAEASLFGLIALACNEQVVVGWAASAAGTESFADAFFVMFADCGDITAGTYGE